MNKLLFVFLIAAAAAFAQPQGQQMQSVKGVVRLNKAPVSTEVLKVKLPRPVERDLPNGIKLLVIESHRVPQIQLEVHIPSGDLRDPGIPGVSDATAALIRQGTKTRSSKDIAEALANIGASLSFQSGSSEGVIVLSSLTENFDAALAIFTDILLNPSFPQDELDKWKTRQRANLEQMKSNPNAVGSELMYKVLYPSDGRQFTHPTLESLDKITRDVILEHYKNYYVPSGDIAGVAGDITPQDAVAKLQKALAGWKGGPVAKITMPMAPAIAEKKVYLIPRPNSVQTLLMVTNRAIERTSPDYLQCQVMNRVLGSGPSSRLFRIVREEKGYTYGIGSGFTASRTQNHFTASTSVRTDVTEPALTEILAQFAEIRDKAVPAGELGDAKSAIVASFVLGLENPSSVLSRWIEQRWYGLPEDYWDTYTQKVMAVTAEDVQRVAKKYVPLDNAQIIAVGDASKIGEALKKFGPVVESPVDGK